MRCLCEHVDVGVGLLKVAHNPECPECNDPVWFEEPPLTPEEEEESGADGHRRQQPVRQGIPRN